MTCVRVVSVVGLQDAGKTMAAVSLVAHLQAQGLTVAAIKHDAHATDVVDWEKPGSDTERLGTAGAAVTMVAGGGQSLIRTRSPETQESIHTLIQRTLHVASTVAGDSCDFVVVEGFKQSDLAKIVILRNEEHCRWLQSAALQRVIAVMGPAGLRADMSPHYPFYTDDEAMQLWSALQTDTRLLWPQ